MKTDICVTYHEPHNGESMELTCDIEVTPEGEVEMTDAASQQAVVRMIRCIPTRDRI